MLKQQGSNRIYTRETDENGRSVIRVVGTNRDENRAFIYMARHFHALGLPVPELYQVSEDEMSYTQQDLGDTILFDHLDNTLYIERARSNLKLGSSAIFISAKFWCESISRIALGTSGTRHSE